MLFVGLMTDNSVILYLQMGLESRLLDPANTWVGTMQPRNWFALDDKCATLCSAMTGIGAENL